MGLLSGLKGEEEGGADSCCGRRYKSLLRACIALCGYFGGWPCSHIEGGRGGQQGSSKKSEYKDEAP